MLGSRTISVDVDVQDILSQVEPTDLLTELGNRKERIIVPQGIGDGDKTLNRVIEDAYLAARATPNLPPEIKEMFWRVFGRALA